MPDAIRSFTPVVLKSAMMVLAMSPFVLRSICSMNPSIILGQSAFSYNSSFSVCFQKIGAIKIGISC